MSEHVNKYLFEIRNPVTGHSLECVAFGRSWKEAQACLMKDFPRVEIIRCVRVFPDKETRND